jgi:DNA helicase HerA-like ATPase
MAEATGATDAAVGERGGLRIVPSAEAIDGTRIRAVFERLHGLDAALQLEMQLVASAGRIEYYLRPHTVELASVAHTVRRVFPEATEIEPATVPEPPADPAAALELQGRGERRLDWQTRLRPVSGEDDAPQFPLASVVDILAAIDTDTTVVYQAVLTPKPAWQAAADLRVDDLTRHQDTLGQRIAATITNDPDPDPSIEDTDRSHRERIDSIQAADTRHAFTVNARAVASGPRAEAILQEMGTAFRPASGQFYGIRAHITTDDDATGEIADRLDAAAVIDQQRLAQRLRRRLPVTSNRSPAIVCDPVTVPNFCLVDGASVSADGRRAMQASPEEQTGLPEPDPEALAQYDAGMLLGYPLTTDDTQRDTPVRLPPSLQPLHAAWFGKTGSGKSTALINAILDNHAATQGADILIDPKGDGMPTEYLQAHYHRYDGLENVYYFDCTETLPAISFFDIRRQLQEGVDRTTAVEDTVDHYIEILTALMGRARFEQAVRSPDIIRYLVKALFDPVHGSDAFPHEALQETAARMHDTRDPPPVVDHQLQRMLTGVAANSKRSFDELMQGVANRIEKVPLDARLQHLFNYTPEQADDPSFDFRDVIDEDAIVIIDTGGLRTHSQRALTLVLLSQLWTALRRRSHHGTDDGEPPLVNLYLEEAATIASSGLVTDLLAQSRAFRLSMTLAMQFPAQLRLTDTKAYAEVLNNVSTIVTGNVAVDDDLAKRLATATHPPADVANRLRALRRGQWFTALPSAFGVDEPRPFLLQSAPIPPGHPESTTPLTDAHQTAFDAALDVTRDRTRRTHGLDIHHQTRQAAMQRHTHPDGDDAPPVADRDSAPGVDPDARVDSALPYTNRLPAMVKYDSAAHALVCRDCDTRYDPTSEGMTHAIRCCHTIHEVDRDSVPICELNLKLTVDERRHRPYTDAQLRFLQAVYDAHQRRFDPDLEYDLITDSMIRLQEYVNIDTPELQELLDADLLAEDCSYPHKLYTVTPDGRDTVNISHREGVAHGHGHGDLSESSLHVAMVELGRQYIHTHYVHNNDSPVVEAVTYHEVDDTTRLDAAGRTPDGDIVVTIEAERSNHDTLRAVPTDYDKMAAHDPDAAIWIVKNRDGAHDVLDALNNPPEGETRVEKEYSRTSPPQQFTIDEPGLTDVFTFQYLRDTILDYPQTA